jgi:hypothetical protein
MADEYNFRTIEAALPVEHIVAQLKQHIWPLLPQG